MTVQDSIRLLRAVTSEVTNEEIEALLHAVYVAGGFTDAALATSLFAGAAVRERGELIIARDTVRGALAGMVIVVKPASPARRLAEPDEAEMHLLAVRLAYRGQGLGERLVHAAAEAAAEDGLARMVLWTQPTMHAAQRLYERGGFSRAQHRDLERGGRAFLVFQKAL